MPLAMITMRESTHGFPSLFYTCLSMGLRLAALGAAGAPPILSETIPKLSVVPASIDCTCELLAGIGLKLGSGNVDHLDRVSIVF